MKESNWLGGLICGGREDIAAKQMAGAYNTAAQERTDDLTLGEAFDREINHLERRVESLKKERDAMSPELLSMKRSQVLRMLREVPEY